MPYLGRRYYVDVIIDITKAEITIEYTASSFKVIILQYLNTQDHLHNAFNEFYHKIAFDKIETRIKKWKKITGLEYNKFRVMNFDKRWGSCTADNKISINFDAIKLPYSLIDYILVHELAQTIIKDHSKEFWAEVSKHLPNWKELMIR